MLIASKNSWTRERKDFSLHTWATWVILWHVCFKTDWVFLALSSVRSMGKVAGNITSIFCHSITCLWTDQCCWDRNHKPGWFMNVPQYLLVEGFKQAFPLYRCNQRVAVPVDCIQRLWDKREEGLLTSHLNKFGISPTCLLRDCLNIPRLPEYSWLIESTVNGKVTKNTANKKCLASVEKVSRRLSIPHGSANCRTFVQESPLHLHKKSWCLPRSAGWLESRPEA